MERRKKPPLAESRNFSANYHILVEKFQQMLGGSLPENIGIGRELAKPRLGFRKRSRLPRREGLEPPVSSLVNKGPVCEIFVGSSVEWFDSQ